MTQEATLQGRPTAVHLHVEALVKRLRAIRGAIESGDSEAAWIAARKANEEVPLRDLFAWLKVAPLDVRSDIDMAEAVGWIRAAFDTPYAGLWFDGLSRPEIIEVFERWAADFESMTAEGSELTLDDAETHGMFKFYGEAQVIYDGVDLGLSGQRLLVLKDVAAAGGRVVSNARLESLGFPKWRHYVGDIKRTLKTNRVPWTIENVRGEGYKLAPAPLPHPPSK